MVAMSIVEEKKMITALYKVHLHCPKCAYDIRKPLQRTPGVHSVDVMFEKGEVTVKGSIGEKEMHKRLEKFSKKKVEILSVEKGKMVKETKETVRTTTIKVFLHCSKCEDDMRRKLLKHRGIHNVKMDSKTQTITIEGIVESEKLLTFIKKRVRKHAEILPQKEGKKEEKKENEVKKKETATVEVKITETTQVAEFKEERKVEAKTPEGKVPYFVHFVYGPQLFSDENPNACSIM